MLDVQITLGPDALHVRGDDLCAEDLKHPPFKELLERWLRARGDLITQAALEAQAARLSLSTGKLIAAEQAQQVADGKGPDGT